MKINPYMYPPLTTRMVSVGAAQGFECLVAKPSIFKLASQKFRGAKYEPCGHVGFDVDGTRACVANLLH